jgi:hypothetical protein
MEAKELAALLNGRQYTQEITNEEAAAAKAAGLVVVFGASDDLMEFRGAIYDELGAWNGTTAHLTSSGLLTNDCDNEDCPHFEKLKATAKTIEACWDEEGYSWIFKTDIPHETFIIKEEGSPDYCRGIVFKLSDA